MSTIQLRFSMYGHHFSKSIIDTTRAASPLARQSILLSPRQQVGGQYDIIYKWAMWPHIGRLLDIYIRALGIYSIRNLVHRWFNLISIPPKKNWSNKRVRFQNQVEGCVSKIDQLLCMRISVDRFFELTSSFDRFLKRAFYLIDCWSEGS